MERALYNHTSISYPVRICLMSILQANTHLSHPNPDFIPCPHTKVRNLGRAHAVYKDVLGLQISVRRDQNDDTEKIG